MTNSFYLKSAALFAAAVLMFSNALPAQPDTSWFPKIAFETDQWDQMIPAGWKLTHATQDDFNADKTIDVAFIIEHIDATTWKDEKGNSVTGHPRILVMAMKQKPKGFYRLIEQSNTFIAPRIDGKPDEFTGMHFARSFLELEFTDHQRSNKEKIVQSMYRFHFELARFYLTHALFSEQNTRTGEYVIYDFNFPNWRVGIRRGNEEEGDVLVQSHLLKRMMLKHFGLFTRPFTWQVMEGVVL